MIKPILVVSLLLVTGCTQPTKLNKAKGEFLCKDKGGLYIIHPLREYPIECRDGSRFGVKQLETVIITDHSYLPQEIE
jgi:hypothetical protein